MTPSVVTVKLNDFVTLCAMRSAHRVAGHRLSSLINLA